MIKTIHLVYIAVAVLVMGLAAGLAILFWPKQTTAPASSSNGGGGGGGDSGGGGGADANGYTSQNMQSRPGTCVPMNLGSPVVIGNRTQAIIDGDSSLENIGGEFGFPITGASSQSPISKSKVSELVDAIFLDFQSSGGNVSNFVVIYDSDEDIEGHLSYSIMGYTTQGAAQSETFDNSELMFMAVFYPKTASLAC